MADRECRSEHGSPAGVSRGCVRCCPNFTGSPLHYLQNLWQRHSQFVTSLSTVHVQNTKYTLRPRLAYRIYTNIHDFGIYLHICVSKRLQKQHTYCQCRRAWGIVYVFFPLRTHKCPTGVVCFKRLIHHDMSKSLKTYKATKQKGDPHEQTENNRPV